MSKIIPLFLFLAIILGGVFFLTQMSNNSTTNSSQESNLTAADSGSAPKECSGQPLVELTEGPYYKAGSPERQKISEPETSGTHLILKGYVYDTNCQPVATAWLDFWQADGDGNYDNAGYNLRGHQFTDENGFFRLETIVPARYAGRTQHIHFKVRKNETGRIITSQLFFPDGQNSSDSIFDDSLIVQYGTDPDGSKFASYNIIVL